MARREKRPDKPETKLVHIAGRWRLDGTSAVYLGPDEKSEPYGICLAPTRFRSGSASVAVTISEAKSAARLLIGYNAATGAYYSVGLGGYDYAYNIDEFAPGRGWRAVNVAGSASQLQLERPQLLEVSITGQHVSLSVEGVRVLETALPQPLQVTKLVSLHGVSTKSSSRTSLSGERSLEYSSSCNLPSPTTRFTGK